MANSQLLINLPGESHMLSGEGIENPPKRASWVAAPAYGSTNSRRDWQPRTYRYIFSKREKKIRP